MQPDLTCRRCGAPTTQAGAPCARCVLELGVAAPPLADDESAPSAPRVEFVPPSVDEMRALFPDLEIESLIGHGGMGAVFRAKQKKLDRDVALKVLPRAMSADRAFAERFLREARALARLSHPNIVAVHDYGETDGVCWLMLEYVDGANLRGVLRAGSMPSRQALSIVRELCDALQYAHDEGVVHRDIKPENVLVDRRGRAKVADFGLAKLVGPAQDVTITRDGQVMGTPHYMAPEQIERPRDVDHRADIYALGVVLYEMLTGSLPRGNFEPPSRRVQVDVKLDEIVLKALEHEPSRRYQHAVDVKTDVDAVGDGARAEGGDGFVLRAGIDERGVFAETSTSADGKPREAASRDALRGWRGFALSLALWIAIAAAWNAGPFLFVAVVAAAIGLFGIRIRMRLREEHALRVALAGESTGARAARRIGAVFVALVGMFVVVQGHVAHWERSVSTWVPGHRGVDDLLTWWRANLWSLVPPSAATNASAEPRIDTLRAEISGGFADVMPVAPLVLICAGLVVLGLAVLVAVQPASRIVPRRGAVRIASELGSLVAAALVVLWIAAPILALRGEHALDSCTRAFQIDAAVADAYADPARPDLAYGEAERRLRSAFAAHGLRADSTQVTRVTDARTLEHYADLLVMRAEATSPFDRWRTSWSGARRVTPEVCASAVRIAGETNTVVKLHAGLYAPGSPEAVEAERVLRAIEADLAP